MGVILGIQGIRIPLLQWVI